MFVKITRNVGLNTTDKGQIGKNKYLLVTKYLLTRHLKMLVKYCFSDLTLKIMQNAHKTPTYTFEFETRRNEILNWIANRPRRPFLCTSNRLQSPQINHWANKQKLITASRQSCSRKRWNLIPEQSGPRPYIGRYLQSYRSELQLTTPLSYCRDIPRSPANRSEPRSLCGTDAGALYQLTREVLMSRQICSTRETKAKPKTQRNRCADWEHARAQFIDA